MSLHKIKKITLQGGELVSKPMQGTGGGWKGKGRTRMGQERKGRDDQEWQGNGRLGRNGKGTSTR